MKTLHLFLATLAASSLLAFAEGAAPAAPAAPAATEKPKRSAEDIFKIFDRDSDGGVTIEEYKIGMTGKMDPARIDGVFKFKDQNGDGKLNVEELMIAPPKATPKPVAKPAAKKDAAKKDAATPEKKQ
jgi:hypothetical protein